MSRRTRGGILSAGASLAWFAALALALPSGAHAQVTAAELTENAGKLVDEGSYRQAIEQLQRALAIDRDYAQAHYFMGYALGRLGEHSIAAEAFLQAARLRPAWPEAHRMAALAAANAGRMEVAWEQLIRAHQAGADMSVEIEIIAEVSPKPVDLIERLAAPRVVLAPLDMSRFEGFNENPFGRQVRTGDASVGAARGQPAAVAGRNLTTAETEDPADRSAPWATQTGSPMVAETLADLDFMMLELARSLTDTLEIGLVRDEKLAEFVVSVELNNMARSTTDRTGGETVSDEPKWLDGAFVARDRETGEEVFRRPLRLTDLRSAATTRGELAVYVRLLIEWARELNR